MNIIKALVKGVTLIVLIYGKYEQLILYKKVLKLILNLFLCLI